MPTFVSQETLDCLETCFIALPRAGGEGRHWHLVLRGMGYSQTSHHAHEVPIAKISHNVSSVEVKKQFGLAQSVITATGNRNLHL